MPAENEKAREGLSRLALFVSKTRVDYVSTSKDHILRNIVLWRKRGSVSWNNELKSDKIIGFR